MCVCDISKENREVIQELNYAQVYTLFLLFYKWYFMLLELDIFYLQFAANMVSKTALAFYLVSS